VFLTAVMEQRVNIKFYVNLGIIPTETYEMLQTVYGDEVLSRSNIFESFKQFKNRHDDLHDDTRSGGVLQTLKMQTITNVHEMVTLDSQNDVR
jgi:hypothetical protein